VSTDGQGPDTAICARHPFDCSVDKHAQEWRDEALRLRAAVANLTAELDTAYSHRNDALDSMTDARVAQVEVEVELGAMTERALAAEAALVTARRDALTAAEGAVRWLRAVSPAPVPAERSGQEDTDD